MKRGTAPLLLLLLSQSFESSAAFNASFHAVPLVDLAGSFDSTASTVRTALSTYGFFYITNHGVPQELIDRQFEQSRLLFEQPAAVKAAMPFNGTLDIGYLGSGGQALDAEGRARDTKEGFMLTNNGVFDPALSSPPTTRSPGRRSTGLRKMRCPSTRGCCARTPPL